MPKLRVKAACREAQGQAGCRQGSCERARSRAPALAVLSSTAPTNQLNRVFQVGVRQHLAAPAGSPTTKRLTVMSHKLSKVDVCQQVITSPARAACAFCTLLPCHSPMPLHPSGPACLSSTYQGCMATVVQPACLPAEGGSTWMV